MYKIISVTPKMLLKTKVFEKKANRSVVKYIGQPFPILSEPTKLRKQFIRVQSSADKYFATNRFVSIRPKKSLR